MQDYQSFKIPRYSEKGKENPLYQRVTIYVTALPSLEDSTAVMLFSSGRKPNDFFLLLGPSHSAVDSFLGARIGAHGDGLHHELRCRRCCSRGASTCISTSPSATSPPSRLWRVLRTWTLLRFDVVFHFSSIDKRHIFVVGFGVDPSSTVTRSIWWMHRSRTMMGSPSTDVCLSVNIKCGCWCM